MGWWETYQRTITFRDGGRAGDALDCYGLLRRIYFDHLQVVLPVNPGITLEGVMRSPDGMTSPDLHTGFAEVVKGYETAFDAAVIRVALPCNGKLRRGWWHVGVITRPGFLLHIDLHKGITERCFRPTADGMPGYDLRPEDVRCFRWTWAGAGA